MISLHVYITPKKGRDLDLKKAICDYWLPAMQKQPGFINAALLNPFATSELEALQAVNVKWEIEENGSKIIKKQSGSEFTLNIDMVFLALGFLYY